MFSLSLFSTIVTPNVLMASMGSNSFVVALIGILGALLLRDNKK